MWEDEEGWKLIADVFSERHHDALPQFTGMNPALGDSSLASFSDAFKLFYENEFGWEVMCVFS